MNKLIKLVAISGISGLLASNLHYLFNHIDNNNFKILFYVAIAIIGVMGVVLDDEFGAFFGVESQGIFALVASSFTMIYLFGSFRAFSLGEDLFGLVLLFLLGIFWIMLLALYLKLLFGNNQEEE